MGTVVSFIPGQNTQSAVVVKLDERLEAGKAAGDYVVLQLRNTGAEWENTQVVHVELCNFEPEAKPWSMRKQGVWIESQATYERIKEPLPPPTIPT